MNQLLNKTTIILIILGFTTLLGCKHLDKLTQFEMDYDATVVVPSSVVVDIPINLTTPDIESNSESSFAVNDTRKNLIEQIILIKLELNITSPSNGDFSFLKSAKIFISAEGLSETEIAFIDEVPENVGNTLILETTGVDLQEYVKKDEFSFRMNTVTAKLITTEHHINIHSVFFVDAKILGI